MKWNQSAKGAIDQIKNKHYPDAIKDFGGEILLVGINYDKDVPAGERSIPVPLRNVAPVHNLTSNEIY